MDICLRLHGVALQYNTVEMGDKIISAAQGRLNEQELAQWLRRLIALQTTQS